MILFSPHRMHIPDGFLSLFVSLIFWLLATLMVIIAIRRVSIRQDDATLPTMGVLAAAIFAGQMLNFAIAGGTSGHLLGATIATILVGPWAGMLVMVSVVAVQAVVFQDGGLLAMGANIFNMAVVGCTVSYLVYRSVLRFTKQTTWGYFLGAGLAAWLSIEFSALAAGLELSLSGTSPANLAIPAMAGIHALIGLGEALITLGAMAFIRSSRPDLLTRSEGASLSNRGVWMAGFIIAVLLSFLAPLASTHPDGLEWVAEQQGFIHLAKPAAIQLIPDYRMPGVTNSSVATILSALIGVTLIIVTMLVVNRLRRTHHK